MRPILISIGEFVRYVNSVSNTIKHLSLQWQCNAKSSAVPFLAFDPDVSVVAYDDLFDEIEADAEAAERGVKAVGAIEAFKNMGLCVCGDADAFVFDPELYFVCSLWLVA